MPVQVDMQSSWESRAAESGKSLSGVLFRGLSEQANGAIDEWHAWIVRAVFATALEPGSSVLDLGCGYGRLSRHLLAERPDIAITGQDLSLNFCRLFNEVAPSVCGGASAIPFRDASFDGAVVVTCLMYAEKAIVPSVLSAIARVVKPGGLVLLLDPGVELQKLQLLIQRKRARSPTGGCGFGRREYRAMVESAGFDVECAGGNPALSLALLLPCVRSSSGGRVGRMLRRCATRDCQRSGHSRIALHRWILARRRHVPE